MAELTLALVLFTDSANADLATLRRSFRIPQRMLLVGLPLTIALGVGTGILLFPHLPLLTVAILAIACFTGGLAFGGLVKERKDLLLSGAEGAGGPLSLLTWVMFGAAFVGRYVGELDARIVGYSLLSLTLIRMLPVSLSLLGLGVRPDAQLFLGWFGPRGLASIVFAVIVAGQNVTGSDTLVATVVCTVTLSILAHGLTANPFANAYAARAETDPRMRA